MVALLFKGGEKERLGNWRPIMLLNVAYKISAKVLQLRLQIMLMEVVDADQTAFMPLCYILDNVLLVQETLDWAKCSNQPIVFLKQSFAKAYDKVGWGFTFLALEKLVMILEFIDLVRLLFKNAEAAVCLNGSITRSSGSRRGSGKDAHSLLLHTCYGVKTSHRTSS